MERKLKSKPQSDVPETRPISSSSSSSWDSQSLSSVAEPWFPSLDNILLTDGSYSQDSLRTVKTPAIYR
eukprot:CAMPEP_0177616340 /NCGR_PEP_ID=MMETSP0419_2-20121207/24083_1 /TAXON_ID=582737 /ORGANISM="Tetraselmis sp., Strain GSL018" /LENGTH=68 /DNA_ID=CAMNT_0019114351 /DNA_START=16 /DNA_END=219 /DNA_ORIENTATION=+